MLIAAAQVAAVSLFAAWAVSSCGGSKSATFACGDSYGKQCGKACGSDADCDIGLGCSGGSCSAGCTPVAGCTDGLVCSLKGACVDATPGVTGTACGTGAKQCPSGFFCGQQLSCIPGCGSSSPCPEGTMCGQDSTCGPIASLAGVGGGSGTGGPFEGDGCVNLTVGFEGRTPTVMLLVDQSGSMVEHFPKGNSPDTRWSILYSALMDPAAGAVKLMESTVRMGLALYSSDGGSAGGKMCPNLTEVPIAINNFATIDTTYKAAKPAHDTPTGPSIDAVVKELAKEPDPKYILLVTDGLPDTCEDPNPSGGAGQMAANDLTVKAAQAAHAAGIGLFIMGVSADIAPAHLQAMANAGAGLDPATTGAMAAKYYVASDSQAALAMQLTGILGSVRNCVFHLGGTVQPGHEADGMVSLDGAPLTINDPNGYKLNNPSELEVLGTACEKIKSNSKGLSISFSCDSFEIAR